MNERRDVKVAQWLAAVQPLQLVLGGLFAFTLNAGFDALDRPAMAGGLLRARACVRRRYST